jgi:hypothetical protein
MPALSDGAPRWLATACTSRRFSGVAAACTTCPRRRCRGGGAQTRTQRVTPRYALNVPRTPHPRTPHPTPHPTRSYDSGKAGVRGAIAVFVDALPSGGGRFFFYDAPPLYDGAAAAAAGAAARASGRGGEGASLSGAQMRAAARVKERSKHLLATLDERAVGFAAEALAARPCTTPGVRCAAFVATPNDMHRCASCGRPGGEHLAGRKLVLTPEGGDVTDAAGRVACRWLWDSRKAAAGTPPAPGFTLALNSRLRLVYTSREDIRVDFQSDGVMRTFHCGAARKPRGGGGGGGSGGSGAAAGAAAAAAARAGVDGHMGLAGMLADLDSSISAARTRVAGLNKGVATGLLDLTGRLSAAGGLGTTGVAFRTTSAAGTGALRFTGTGPNAGAFSLIESRAVAREATEREVPPALIAALTARVTASGAGGEAAPSSASPRKRGGDGPPPSSPPRRQGADAFFDGGSEGDVADMLSQLAATGRIQREDGYGSLTGAAMHGGEWIAGADVLRKLQGVHPIYTRTAMLKAASGKFDAWQPLVRSSDDLIFRGLDRVTGDGVDAFLAATARPEQTVLLAFLHPADSACRRVLQMLEHVNGTLAAAFPDDPQYAVAVEAPPPPPPPPPPSAGGAGRGGKPPLAGTGAGGGGGGTAQGRGGGGGGGRVKLCPYRLARYDMSAASAGQLKRFGVRTLPFFALFRRGHPVYTGAMGGARVIVVPSSNRPLNVLIVERSGGDQVAAERAAKARRMPSDLACGTFDAAEGRLVGTCDAAVAAITATLKRGQAARAALAAARQAAAAAGLAGPEAGMDATHTAATDYAFVLLDAGCGGEEEVARVAAAMRAASAAAGSGGRGAEGGAPAAAAPAVFAGATPIALVGRSLLVACWPLGAVPFHSSMCATCRRLIRRGVGTGTGGGGAAAVEGAPGGEWACPHCGVVHNATRDRLLGGRASVAVCKPVKPGMLAALTDAWRRLTGAAAYTSGGGGSGGGGDTGSLLAAIGADLADARVRTAIARAPVVGQTRESKGGLAADDVHLGLTHNDVLQRLAEAARG